MSTHPATTVSAVIVADDGIGHLEGHIIRVGPAGPLHGNGHMGQRQGIVTVADLKQYMARLRNHLTVQGTRKGARCGWSVCVKCEHLCL